MSRAQVLPDGTWKLQQGQLTAQAPRSIEGYWCQAPGTLRPSAAGRLEAVLWGDWARTSRWAIPEGVPDRNRCLGHPPSLPTSHPSVCPRLKGTKSCPVTIIFYISKRVKSCFIVQWYKQAWEGLTVNLSVPPRFLIISLITAAWGSTRDIEQLQ